MTSRVLINQRPEWQIDLIAVIYLNSIKEEIIDIQCTYIIYLSMYNVFSS